MNTDDVSEMCVSVTLNRIKIVKKAPACASGSAEELVPEAGPWAPPSDAEQACGPGTPLLPACLVILMPI